MGASFAYQDSGRTDMSQRPKTGAPVRRSPTNATGPVMTPWSLVALQRQAGNAAVAALVAQRLQAPTVAVQRSEDEAEEPAGCGFCIDPGPAGTQAHTQIQSKMGALGVDSEVKVVAGGGRGTKGRLDLARWDDTAIEIGEIKPGHPTGLAQGRDDLDFYKGVLEKTEDPRFKGKAVRMLADPGPAPMVFATATRTRIQRRRRRRSPIPARSRPSPSERAGLLRSSRLPSYECRLGASCHAGAGLAAALSRVRCRLPLHPGHRGCRGSSGCRCPHTASPPEGCPARRRGGLADQ
ncbi:hypothetical protein [Micromonospora sp. NBC_01412]|uniref:hypothetical protein n=1 Tax=Micromonospora sp. NBC_01412 TaxID=2903590 RepID=UPI00324B50D9